MAFWAAHSLPKGARLKVEVHLEKIERAAVQQPVAAHKPTAGQLLPQPPQAAGSAHERYVAG